MKTYQPRSDTTIDDEGKTRIVYGIELPSENISVKDVFCNRKEAETFIKLCNDLDLSPLHLQDVLQDIL